MALLGRVVKPARRTGRRQGPIETKKWRTIENRAPGVIERQGVKQPLQTGIRAIDALIPDRQGPRELIIGDRGTGKTAIAVDTIINQKGKDVFCIYVAIGQKKLDRRRARADARTERRDGIHHHRHVSPAEPAALKWIAPFAGCAMGEELMYAGKDVLIIYDNSRSTRKRTVKSRSCCAARRAAKPTRATFSFCIRAFGTRGETLR